MAEAKSKGVKLMAVTNVVGSSISRASDYGLYIWAGPEITVASTKAYTTQLIAMPLFAVLLGQQNGRLSQAEAKEIIAGLRDLPAQAATILEHQEEAIKVAAGGLAKHDDVFFLGLNLDYVVAMSAEGDQLCSRGGLRCW